jgi:hypothetical protein
MTAACEPHSSAAFRAVVPMIVRLLGAKSDPPGALLQVNA